MQNKNLVTSLTTKKLMV